MCALFVCPVCACFTYVRASAWLGTLSSHTHTQHTHTTHAHNTHTTRAKAQEQNLHSLKRFLARCFLGAFRYVVAVFNCCYHLRVPEGINTLQHTATPCNTLQHPATPCNTLQHTATHCSTLQHTATHCNTSWLFCTAFTTCVHMRESTPCNTLQHTATHCNTRQHPATLRNTLPHDATPYHTMQHTAAHCITSWLCCTTFTTCIAQKWCVHVWGHES